MNKIIKKFTSALLIFALTFVLNGCSLNSVSKKSSDNAALQTETQTTYPLTIKDSYGEDVTLKEEPKKVISLAPNITELIYNLDAQKKLYGRTDYCDYPEEALDVESVGTMRTPDIEKIISLEPDIVIASTHFSEENAKKLKDNGINVMCLYQENDFDGVYSMIEKLGKVLNKNEKATETVNNMKKTISEVSEKVKNLKKPSVYYVVSYGDSGDYSAPENTFVGQIINLAGGKNIVPENDSWSYSRELLIENDPDIIVVRKGEKDKFMSTKGYEDLTAVKEGKVYEIDNNIIDRQGYRNAEGVYEMAKIFHEDAFK
ncbi:ABC transporter substrate-binding protein [Clostridium sp. BJN0001]|uniref:ABC transporter substrate-binding protein n=1 Tax=Clostridium sp. BJN0001 TaxID=2930219 RepID=UPI001FD0EE37|nr:ABC transporter substrate-binding protein [Clostridium sp. BJN0001]